MDLLTTLQRFSWCAAPENTRPAEGHEGKGPAYPRLLLFDGAPAAEKNKQASEVERKQASKEGGVKGFAVTAWGVHPLTANTEANPAAMECCNNHIGAKERKGSMAGRHSYDWHSEAYYSDVVFWLKQLGTLHEGSVVGRLYGIALFLQIPKHRTVDASGGQNVPPLT